MRSAVTLSLVPQARGGPFVYWDGMEDACAQAAALGFDAVEIFPPNAAALDVAAVRTVVMKHHLAVAAVGTKVAQELCDGRLQQNLSRRHIQPTDQRQQ